MGVHSFPSQATAWAWGGCGQGSTVFLVCWRFPLPPPFSCPMGILERLLLTSHVAVMDEGDLSPEGHRHLYHCLPNKALLVASLSITGCSNSLG